MVLCFNGSSHQILFAKRKQQMLEVLDVRTQVWNKFCLPQFWDGQVMLVTSGKIHCYPLQTVPLCSAVPARSSCRMVLHICGRSKSLERSKGRWFGVTLRTQHDMDVNNMGSRNWLWGLIILIITIYWKNGIHGILRSSESNDLMCKWECHG